MSLQTQTTPRPSATWIATGLAFPSLTYRTTLRNLGIPDWAIRLDLLGIMLPPMSAAMRHPNGKWSCLSVGSEFTPMQCDTEADAKACKLAHLLESGQMTVDVAVGRLEEALSA